MASKFKTLMGRSNGASFKKHYGVGVSEWIERDRLKRESAEKSKAVNKPLPPLKVR